MPVMNSSTWWGHPSVVLSTPRLQATVVPHLGAKIASIIDLRRGIELLVQPTWMPHADARRSLAYVDAEMSGWDEMFPSIIGDEYPDHGEAWSESFSESHTDNQIRTTLECATVPVTFERTVSLENPASLRCDYRVSNRGRNPASVLWAAHPQFVLEDGDELAVDDVAHWACTHPGVLTAEESRRPNIDAVPQGTSAKWWTAEHETSVESAGLLRRGEPLFRLSWEPRRLPHLGVWIDRAHFSSHNTMSLQPATSWHDDVALARTNGTALVIAPGGSRHWSVTMTVPQ